MPRTLPVVCASVFFAHLLSSAASAAPAVPSADGKHSHNHAHAHRIQFDLRSVRDGNWSDPTIWQPARLPKEGDRVLVARDTRVTYDSASKSTIRLLQVVGTLAFARDCDTELNVALLKVQNSDECSESGFSCDFPGVNEVGEPQAPQPGAQQRALPTLEVGTLAEPIPAKYTARIRLHYLEGLDKVDAPAIVCCSGRMEFHGAPLSRTWVKLGANAAVDAKTITLAEPVSGWRVGDEIIVTASKKTARRGSYRDDASKMGTEERRITKIEGTTLHLDEPLKLLHYGEGEFRSEAANLSRNVIVESADPAGVRGHTMYHAFSQGGISYARFAHLGKEGVLGRYAIHFHLVGDTMRGSQVLGAAIVDSQNRWVTIHGTEYLVVRDCVGYRSVGHGFFMEDGTEIYNLLDRNLGVQAFQTKRLPKQVLPFDPNDGAAFWWANGRNTLVRNVTCENDEYGYRFDMKNLSSFSSTLPITMPDGTSKRIDVRTIPIWRFEENEAHSEGVYGLVVACNGDSQPDTAIRDQNMLDQINKIDWTGPDVKHPHVIRGLKIWEAHYAFRPHSPSMLIEDIRIDRVAYGIYRPTFDNQVFRNLHLTNAGGEPFNRGMDDASAQAGRITVDGLKIGNFVGGNQMHPVVHMSDNNLSGTAASYFRNVTWANSDGKRPVFNRGGSTRVDPFVPVGVPYYVYDHYGPGRHAKIVSTKAADLMKDGNKYKAEPPLTGDESVVAEVSDVQWPKLLDPVDDLPPATIITQAVRSGAKLRVAGISHDNGEITSVTVNGQAAVIQSNRIGVADWSLELPLPADGKIMALATDRAGNIEQTGHMRQTDARP
ncbi:MAG: G8 domain-containing protein [Planctomycetia bacterium]|nr:G8 domain-containing protein [Planctomycetia bacterium]